MSDNGNGSGSNPLEQKIEEMGFTPTQVQTIVGGALALGMALGKKVCPLECAIIIQEATAARMIGLEYDMQAEVMARAVIAEACDDDAACRV